MDLAYIFFLIVRLDPLEVTLTMLPEYENNPSAQGFNIFELLDIVKYHLPHIYIFACWLIEPLS